MGFGETTLEREAVMGDQSWGLGVKEREAGPGEEGGPRGELSPGRRLPLQISAFEPELWVRGHRALVPEHEEKRVRLCPHTYRGDDVAIEEIQALEPHASPPATDGQPAARSASGDRWGQRLAAATQRGPGRSPGEMRAVVEGHVANV